MMRLAIQWNRLAPYHFARLRTAVARLRPSGIEITALETATVDDTNMWRVENGAFEFDRVVALPGENFHRVNAVRMWNSVKAALDRIRPDAVAVNGWSTPDAWSALAWCKLHRRPAILLTDSKYDDGPRSSRKEWLKRRLVARFDSALCAGSPHREYLERLGMRPERIFYGLDAVDNDYFRRRAQEARNDPAGCRRLPGLESPDRFFVAVARFAAGKNLDRLLRSYARYRQLTVAAQPWRLVLLGDGAGRASLENQVRSERIPNVSFAGYREIEELPAYYGLASAFVHTAANETWGLVVNEAMAAGLPVLISSRCGCARDLVREGENGFVFDPGDEDRLAGLMALVSSGEVDLERMGRASRRIVSEWGPERFTEGLKGALSAAMDSEHDDGG